MSAPNTNEFTTSKRPSSPPSHTRIVTPDPLTADPSTPINDDLPEDTRPLAERATRTPRKSAAAFKNDDASTLVEGKGRRDVNGKVMTKRELAAEGALRVVIYSCVVM
jgi:hypothetical protein